MVIAISEERRNSKRGMKISFGLSFFLAETVDPISSIPCIFHSHVKYPPLHPPPPLTDISISPRQLLLYSIFRHYVFLDLFSRFEVLYIPRDDNLADPRRIGTFNIHQLCRIHVRLEILREKFAARPRDLHIRYARYDTAV